MAFCKRKGPKQIADSRTKGKNKLLGTVHSLVWYVLIDFQIEDTENNVGSLFHCVDQRKANGTKAIAPRPN